VVSSDLTKVALLVKPPHIEWLTNPSIKPPCNLKQQATSHTSSNQVGHDPRFKAKRQFMCNIVRVCPDFVKNVVFSPLFSVDKCRFSVSE